ncbi:MAG: ribose 5-phosphate isomerase B, partial [Bacillota bacterium]
MKVAIGSDHAGFELKEKVLKHLKDSGVDVKDYGTYSEESMDYNDVALQVSHDVRDGKKDRGILMCGTGIGMSIQANKVEGIRAAHVHDVFSARDTRRHNDSNVLTMGGRVLGVELAEMIVDTWLGTEFSGDERHVRRVNKLT